MIRKTLIFMHHIYVNIRKTLTFTHHISAKIGRTLIFIHHISAKIRKTLIFRNRSGISTSIIEGPYQFDYWFLIEPQYFERSDNSINFGTWKTKLHLNWNIRAFLFKVIKIRIELDENKLLKQLQNCFTGHIVIVQYGGTKANMEKLICDTTTTTKLYELWRYQQVISKWN